MQITLVQSEIEQALKNYINEQVNVKEGMEITIAFKATRGEEGNTAVIDIVPSSVKPTTPVKRAAAVVTKAEPKPEPEPKEPVKVDPPFQPDAQASDTASSESTDGVVAEPQNVETASAEAPVKKTPSLFGNLGK